MSLVVPVCTPDAASSGDVWTEKAANVVFPFVSDLIPSHDNILLSNLYKFVYGLRPTSVITVNSNMGDIVITTHFESNKLKTNINFRLLWNTISLSVFDARSAIFRLMK
jgi:hypothetical protein